MENNEKAAGCICKSVFKSGEDTISKEQFTRMWIELINRIEKGKSLTIARKQ